jgi:hypothetical protein
MGGHRHLPAEHILRSKAVLGGLHHEYWLERWPHEARNEFLWPTAIFEERKWLDAEFRHEYTHSVLVFGKGLTPKQTFNLAEER